MNKGYLFSTIKEVNKYMDKAIAYRNAGDEHNALTCESIADDMLDELIEPAWRASRNTFNYQIKLNHKTNHYYAIVTDR